jgi:hypothetical protein
LDDRELRLSSCGLANDRPARIREAFHEQVAIGNECVGGFAGADARGLRRWRRTGHDSASGSDAYPDADADAYAYAYAYAHAYPHANSDTYAYPHADAYSDAYSYAHTHGAE